MKSAPAAKLCVTSCEPRHASDDDPHMQYRMGRDIMDHQFLGPRIADKLVLSLIVMSLYFAVSFLVCKPALRDCDELSLTLYARKVLCPKGGAACRRENELGVVLQVGANQAPSNVNNLTAVLFLWTILPGYAAASYMPTIVLERPLFVRCAASHAPPCACSGSTDEVRVFESHVWIVMAAWGVCFPAGSAGSALDAAHIVTGCAPTCRERNDGLYRPSTYLLFKMVEEMTIFFFLSLVTTSIVFGPCRLGGSFLLFWLVNFVTTATGIGEPCQFLACTKGTCSAVSTAEVLCAADADQEGSLCTGERPLRWVLHSVHGHELSMRMSRVAFGCFGAHLHFG